MEWSKFKLIWITLNTIKWNDKLEKKGWNYTKWNIIKYDKLK